MYDFYPKIKMVNNFQYKIYLPIFVAVNLILCSVKTDSLNTQNTMKNDLKYGVVKFYNEEQGFGYIIDEESRDEIFVYEDGLIDEIYDNDEVQYYKRDTRKGYEAFDVRLRN